MIARCDAVQNYMFLRDSQVSGWIAIWEVAMNWLFLFHTGARLNNLILYNIIGWQIPK